MSGLRFVTLIGLSVFTRRAVEASAALWQPSGSPREVNLEIPGLSRKRVLLHFGAHDVFTR